MKKEILEKIEDKILNYVHRDPMGNMCTTPIRKIIEIAVDTTLEAVKKFNKKI